MNYLGLHHYDHATKRPVRHSRQCRIDVRLDAASSFDRNEDNTEKCVQSPVPRNFYGAASTKWFYRQHLLSGGPLSIAQGIVIQCTLTPNGTLGLTTRTFFISRSGGHFRECSGGGGGDEGGLV